MDQYQALRTIHPLTVLSALGVDTQQFKKRTGKSEFYGRCPICQPKHNQTAFSINLDGRWNCFAGGHGGKGAIDLVKALRGCGFKDAVAFLQDAFPAGTPSADQLKEKSPAVDDSVASADVEPKPLAKDTWRKFAVPCPWLEERVPDAGVRERYGVFCYSNPSRKSAWSGRVMLPVRDVDGALYGYLGRHTGDTPEVKYLFPKNLPKSRFLFGAHEILAGMFGPAPLRYVVVAESPFCCMKLAMWKIPCVSPFGWSLSSEQIEILANLTRAVCYLPDRNKAGQESAVVVQSLARRLWVKARELPTGKDDPELLEENELRALLPRG